MEHNLRRLCTLVSQHNGLLLRTLHPDGLSLAGVFSSPCSGCQIRRFQVSSGCASHNSSKYVKSMRQLYQQATARVMSSSSQKDQGSVVQELVREKNTADSPKSNTANTPGNVPIDTIIKVQPTLKTNSKKKQKIDITQSYYENIFITPLRALNEYLLESGDLNDIKPTRRRSPYPEKEGITVYLRTDVERRAIAKWGSLEILQREKKRLELLERRHNTYIFHERKAKKSYRDTHFGLNEEKPFIFNPSQPEMPETIFKHGPGKVVLYAIAVNATNCVVKLWAWLYTGSHSMFAEFIHSVADTANQLILAVGIHQSLKQPDLEHPYGWMTSRNISSLISGVGIFCMGAGLSCYHGIQGLMHPESFESLYWAMAVLTGSFVSEGATLLVAVNQIRTSAKDSNMTSLEYILRGQDPSTNVVLLEDLAAVTGVGIALGCMGISQYTGNPMADAVGSLLIGSLLGAVATFIIYTNSVALVGRSIPYDKKQELMKELEGDRMIRALHDVKATDMGGSFVRFKAEVDFDGKELTRYYLEKHDLEKILQEVQGLSTIEDLETFMLQHGENIVDTLGGEVDRIEKNLKKRHPEVRHVDLEQL